MMWRALCTAAEPPGAEARSRCAASFTATYWTWSGSKKIATLVYACTTSSSQESDDLRRTLASCVADASSGHEARRAWSPIGCKLGNIGCVAAGLIFFFLVAHLLGQVALNADLL